MTFIPIARSSLLRRSNLKAEIATLPPVARNDTRCARNDNQAINGWRNEGGEDLGPLAGGEDEKGQS